MTKYHPEIHCRFLKAWKGGKRCRRRGQILKQQPLSQSCCGKLRICEVRGDRQTCARMASLGVLPGAEVDLICEAPGQCLVRINGATMSVDGLVAENIMVTPAQPGEP
jgi:ferrous iron transport protein A